MKVCRQSFITPRCASKPSPKSKKSRSNAKRPRSNNSGFGKKETPETKSEGKAAEKLDEPEEEEATEESGPDLQKMDSNGISLEHRLREEILHPLRKPKQTFFGTLAFSATLGFFFAVSRYLAKKDEFGYAAKNIAIDVVALVLFAFLTWREFEFGRRSLNSIAGRPQARDLPIVRLQKPSVTVPILDKKPRLSTLLGGRDLVIVAGRRVDVLKYLGRCVASSSEAAIVAFPTDATAMDADLIGVEAVASGEVDDKKDWIAWLRDAVPPRRNIALFKIENGDDGKDAANAYVVAVDDPIKTPLPGDAKRPEVVEV